jgi:hypothetical protein
MTPSAPTTCPAASTGSSSATVFGASLNGLMTHPARYGWNWTLLMDAPECWMARLGLTRRQVRQVIAWQATVGMDIGSGLVIQASETGEPIMITPLTGYWQPSTVAIRRIV